MNMTATEKHSFPLWLFVLLGLVILLQTRFFSHPFTNDESAYFYYSSEIADIISKTGDWKIIYNYSNNFEHPPLVKIQTALTFLLLGAEKSEERILIARTITLLYLLGTLVIIWYIDEIAAFFFFLIHGSGMLSVAYQLDIPYVFFSTLAMAIFFHARNCSSPQKYLCFSAMSCGIGLACKFITALTWMSLALLILRLPNRTKNLFLFSVSTIATFFVLNPRLWISPYGNLMEAVYFHFNYSHTQHVLSYNFSWYSTISTIFYPFDWPKDASIVALLILALGIPFWRKFSSIWWVWFLISLAGMCAWPVKWMQYRYAIIPSFALLTAESLRHIYSWCRLKLSSYKQPHPTE